jgi:hypothetical protein
VAGQAGFARAGLADQDGGEVVVEPEEVKRQGDQLKVNVSKNRESRLGLGVVLEHVLGARGVKDQIEEKAAQIALGSPTRRARAVVAYRTGRSLTSGSHKIAS